MSLKGQLLVATPVLLDPNFHRAVILLLEHTDEGALGVVLNRPSGLDVGEPLPEWGAFAWQPGVVFMGGPVSRTSVIALARVAGDAPSASWAQVLGQLGVVDLSHGPEALSGTLDAVRVFAGYAGWGGGQLEDELAEGAWYVVDAEPGDAFTDDPDHLWRDVLARQAGELARVAQVPSEPRLN